MNRKRPPFPGLTLSEAHRGEIRNLRRKHALTDRHWRRLRTLEMLDRGLAMTKIASALGTYPREVRRVGWRYLEGGFEHAMREDSRYLPDPMLDDRQKAQVIALACTDPPQGRARWTVVLLTEEVNRQRIVKTVGRETIRKVLAEHGLKPWREKNVVRC